VKKMFSLIVGLCLLSVGCGKVSKWPVAPIVNPTTVLLSFDTGINGWLPLNAQFMGVTFAVASAPVSWTDLDSVAYSTAHTYNGGSGSLQINVALEGVGDKLDSGVTFNGVNPGFLGHDLSAWVYWDSGLTTSSGKVIAKFYALDHNWKYDNGADTTLVQGRWVQITWAPTMATIDMTNINVWGIEVYGSTGPFSPGVIYVSNIMY
jgi:hypothetical protein